MTTTTTCPPWCTLPTGHGWDAPASGAIDALVAGLVQRMQAQGISRRELASRTGISARTLSRRLADGSTILVNELAAMCAVLGIAPSELVREAVEAHQGAGWIRIGPLVITRGVGTPPASATRSRSGSTPGGLDLVPPRPPSTDRRLRAV